MPHDTSQIDVQVTDNPAETRFEVHVGAELAGFAEYIPLPGKVIVTHTEVFDAFEGKGVGGRLAAGALELLRADGRLIQPLCRFFAGYLDRHPEYADIVDTTTPR